MALREKLVVASESAVKQRRQILGKIGYDTGVITVGKAAFERNFTIKQSDCGQKLSQIL